MLIASAPWSTASDDRRGDARVAEVGLEDQQPAAEPGAGEADAVVAGAAQASDATCVPWPTVSTVAAAVPSASKSTAPRDAAGELGMRRSAPVSMTATVAPAPWMTSHAPREAAARGPPLDRRARRGVRRGLGRGQRRVVGLEARRAAALGLDARHARVGAQPRGERAQRLAAARAHGDEADLRDAEAGRAAPRGGRRERARRRTRDAAGAAAGASSVTSRRPVASGARAT